MSSLQSGSICAVGADADVRHLIPKMRAGFSKPEVLALFGEHHFADHPTLTGIRFHTVGGLPTGAFARLSSSLPKALLYMFCGDGPPQIGFAGHVLCCPGPPQHSPDPEEHWLTSFARLRKATFRAPQPNPARVARIFRAIVLNDGPALSRLVRANPGAHPDASRTPDGLTPLIVAAIGGRPECAARLVDMGASARAIDNSGLSCAQVHALISPLESAGLAQLIRAGAEFGSGNPPALSHYCRALAVESARAVLASDPGAAFCVDASGHGPVHWVTASFLHNPGAAQELLDETLDHGANINSRTHIGDTAAHILADTLTDALAGYSAPDRSIAIAAATSFASRLINRGLVTNVRDGMGETDIALAERAGLNELAAIFRAAATRKTLTSAASARPTSKHSRVVTPA